MLLVLITGLYENIEQPVSTWNENADGSGLVLLTNNEVNFDSSSGWLGGW